jgi:hypothetical protein
MRCATCLFLPFVPVGSCGKRADTPCLPPTRPRHDSPRSRLSVGDSVPTDTLSQLSLPRRGLRTIYRGIQKEELSGDPEHWSKVQSPKHWADVAARRCVPPAAWAWPLWLPRSRQWRSAGHTLDGGSSRRDRAIQQRRRTRQPSLCCSFPSRKLGDARVSPSTVPKRALRHSPLPAPAGVRRLVALGHCTELHSQQARPSTRRGPCRRNPLPHADAASDSGPVRTFHRGIPWWDCKKLRSWTCWLCMGHSLLTVCPVHRPRACGPPSGHMQLAYGASIVTFVGAVHWGLAMGSSAAAAAPLGKKAGGCAAPFPGESGPHLRARADCDCHAAPCAAAALNERYVWSVVPSLGSVPAVMLPPGPGHVCIALLLGGEGHTRLSYAGARSSAAELCGSTELCGRAVHSLLRADAAVCSCRPCAVCYLSDAAYAKHSGILPRWVRGQGCKAG